MKPDFTKKRKHHEILEADLLSFVQERAKTPQKQQSVSMLAPPKSKRLKTETTGAAAKLIDLNQTTTSTHTNSICSQPSHSFTMKVENIKASVFTISFTCNEEEEAKEKRSEDTLKIAGIDLVRISFIDE